jgi:hypothetical protein
LPLLSLLAAVTAGIAALTITVYLYDRGSSKGNDLAVALIAFNATVTFTLVTGSTFLWSRRGNLSWTPPALSLAVCLGAVVFQTVFLWSNFDEYFAVFFYIAWTAVAVSGGAALVVSRQIFSRAASGSHANRSRENSL